MGEGITQIQIEVLPHPYLSQRVGHDAARGWGGVSQGECVTRRESPDPQAQWPFLFLHPHTHTLLSHVVTFTKSMQNLHAFSMLGFI